MAANAPGMPSSAWADSAEFERVWSAMPAGGRLAAMKIVPVVALFAIMCGGNGFGGGQRCTEIGCADGLMVGVTSDARWPAGEYRFVIDVEGTTTTCTGALPLPECGTQAITCDREGVVRISESGCALPADQHAFGDLYFEETLPSVRVEILHEERSVAMGSFTPTYQTLQPNGPGCGPTCRNASVQLPVDFGAR